MTELNCQVIQDLLPLYIDGICSEQSGSLVENHIQNCHECQELLQNMSSDLSSTASAIPFNEKKIFKNFYKKIIMIVISLTIMISCITINGAVGGSNMEGAAIATNLFLTVIYMVIWGSFAGYTKNHLPFQKISLLISSLTCISTILCMFFNSNGQVNLFIRLLTVFPFYGLRLFGEWADIYIIITILSIIMSFYNTINIHKIKNITNINLTKGD